MAPVSALGTEVPLARPRAMLSISGKLAALFAQSVNDEVVIEAVNDI